MQGDVMERAAEVLERHGESALAAELRGMIPTNTVIAGPDSMINGEPIPEGIYALYRPIDARHRQHGHEALLRAMALPPPPEEG